MGTGPNIKEPGELHRDPGSFRDPASTVLQAAGGLYRGLSAEGLADWEAVAATGLVDELVTAGKVVATELVDPAERPAGLAETYAAALRHERVPFVSYPYEWSFGMLRAAALLQLEVIETALDKGVMVKDATPYNVQWRGASPVFVDLGSFEPLREGEPWAGYRQFCMLFLYPLLLQAHVGLDFQPLLRGRIEGISPGECRLTLRGRHLLRRGVPTHVILHARAERRYRDRRRDARKELHEAGFGAGLIRANVRGLRRLVESLTWDAPASPWSSYGQSCAYAAVDTERKREFVRRAAATRRRRIVWDLGSNEGEFARLAAEEADAVVALDSDHAVVEKLYRSLAAAGGRGRVLPLVVDVVDPSPGLGWRGLERAPLEARGRPELTLCLALVHHLAITHNLPLGELVGWLADLGGDIVVEFATREDELVRRLLAAKRAGSHPEYERETFERLLDERFEVQARETLPAGTRTLYFATPR